MSRLIFGPLGSGWANEDRSWLEMAQAAGGF